MKKRERVVPAFSADFRMVEGRLVDEIIMLLNKVLRLLVLIVTILLWVSWVPCLAQPAQIIVIRHAEKPDDPADIHLSLKGRERAMALVPFLTETPEFLANGLPVALFAAGSHKASQSVRPEETLAPLGKRLNMVIRTEFSSKDSKSLARYVSSNPVFQGKTVVICWVHDYIPELLEALGGDKTVIKKWKSGSFDRVLLVKNADRRTTLLDMPQKLLFGDASR